MHTLGGELPLKEVRGHASRLPLVGAVLLRPDQGLQSHLDHQTLDGLVIDRLPEAADRSRDPTIAIAPLMGFEDRFDPGLQRCMPIGQGRDLLPIIERAAGQARKLQQPVERIERP